MKKLSRSEQMLAEKTVCILLVRGENEAGGKIFAYVALRADKMEEFMKAQQRGTFFPEEYGIVIESGEGEPSEAIREKMTKEYGFNHETMVDIQTPEKAQELTGELVTAARPPSEFDE